MLREDYDRFGGLDIFQGTLLSGMLPNGVMEAQGAADRRARELSRRMYIYACRRALEIGVGLTYETRQEYESLLRGDEGG